MKPTAPEVESTIVRRLFEAWSMEIPASFEEVFIAEDGYWHGYDDHRSISVTSAVVSDDQGPVAVARLAAELKPGWKERVRGQRLADLPAGLSGWVEFSPAPKSARARMMLQGMLIVDGRVLLTTITSDDLEWARTSWLSIRNYRVRAGAVH